MNSVLGNPEFLLYLPNAVQNAFKMQIGIDVKADWVFDRFKVQSNDIVVSINLCSTKSKGVLAFLISRQTLRAITNKIFGEDLADINSQNADGALEFLNIIYASARKKVNEKGHDFEPAIPKMGLQPQVATQGTPNSPVSTLLCKSEFGTFYLQLSLGMCK